jgi:hypothetical protein
MMKENVSQVECALTWAWQGQLPEWLEIPDHNRQELVAILAEMLINHWRGTREEGSDDGSS